MKRLEWYCMFWSKNNNRLEYINVISDELINEVTKCLKKKMSYGEIEETIKQYLFYHFWSKCEWEIIVKEFSLRNEEEEKIDVWYQIKPNLGRITEYLINELSSSVSKTKLMRENELLKQELKFMK